MEYDTETKNRQDILLALPHCGTCVCSNYRVGREFKDRHGDVWIRTDLFTVRRVSDGNYGGWFKGQGLTLVTP